MFCGPPLDSPAQLADIVAGAAVVVDDLEAGPKHVLAHVHGLQRVLRLALLALKMTYSHFGLPFVLTFALSTVWRKGTEPGHTSPGIGHLPACDIGGGCRGFVGPGPPPPLDVYICGPAV